LAQAGQSYDMSPNIAANNDEPQAANPHGKSRLWLEDWSEQDEARLQRNDHHWEGYIA